jgi:hypothetical protein
MSSSQIFLVWKIANFTSNLIQSSLTRVRLYNIHAYRRANAVLNIRPSRSSVLETGIVTTISTQVTFVYFRSNHCNETYTEGYENDVCESLQCDED